MQLDRHRVYRQQISQSHWEYPRASYSTALTSQFPCLRTCRGTPLLTAPNLHFPIPLEVEIVDQLTPPQVSFSSHASSILLCSGQVLLLQAPCAIPCQTPQPASSHSYSHEVTATQKAGPVYKLLTSHNETSREMASSHRSNLTK